MKNEKTFNLSPGFYFTQKYDTYESMLSATKVWSRSCTYQMQENAFKGEFHFLHLNALLLSYVKREDSLYFDAIPPSDSISLAIIEKCEYKACFGAMKVLSGDIIFFDSIHNFITNKSIKYTIITIPKIYLRKRNLLALFNSYLNKKATDTNAKLSQEMHDTLQDFLKKKDTIQDDLYYTKTENNIIKLLVSMLDEQEPRVQKLTKGESIILDIRDSLYKKIDKRVDIKLLSTSYKIGERTLQKSFKSVLGFSPLYFLRALKLNHVHKELKKSHPSTTTVTKVATKWGFNHMGRFGTFYKELFGENPSVTLLQEYIQNDELEDFCVLLNEEL